MAVKKGGFRYSANDLRTSLTGSREIGNTSSWVVSFHSSGSNAPDASSLNFINGKYAAVEDVKFSHGEVTSHDITVGAGLRMSIPVFYQKGTSVDVTFLDSHHKHVRVLVDSWMRKLPLDKGQAPTLKGLKDFCMCMSVYHFDKQIKKLDLTDNLLIVPSGSFDFSGNQRFEADSFPIAFNILGWN